jgi:hypothetical protein
MSSEQRHTLRELSSLIQWNDGKGTASAGFPVYGKVFGIGLGGGYLSIIAKQRI